MDRIDMHVHVGRVEASTLLDHDGNDASPLVRQRVELARECARHRCERFGVTCNAVGPCPVRTKLTASVPAHKIQALIDRQAVRRWGLVEDVVNVVEFFLRPESAMVTGQVIYLGGAG